MITKKFPLFCKYCKKPGHLVEKCYKLHGFPPNFKFTRQKVFQSSAQGHAVTSNEFSGDPFLLDKEPTDQGKLLSAEQLAQVMQMLQHVKNSDQGTNNSEAITSVNCAGITLCPNPFSLNLHVDPKSYNRNNWIIDSGATEHMSYNKDFFFDFKPLPKSIYVSLPNSQTI